MFFRDRVGFDLVFGRGCLSGCWASVFSDLPWFAFRVAFARPGGVWNRISHDVCVGDVFMDGVLDGNVDVFGHVVCAVLLKKSACAEAEQGKSGKC